MMHSSECDDIESNLRHENSLDSTKAHQYISTIDWEGYSKSGNKAASAWLICLLVVMGVAIHQASLSTIVSEQTAIRSANEDSSFASPDLEVSGSSLRRNTMDVSEETIENSSLSLELAEEKSLETSSGPFVDLFDRFLEKERRKEVRQTNDPLGGKSDEEKLKLFVDANERFD